MKPDHARKKIGSSMQEERLLPERRTALHA
jgi:hypothetical protein